MSLVQSAVADEISTDLTGLVAQIDRRAGGDTAQAHARLRVEIADGGWLDLADRLTADRQDVLLRDLTAIAERWGTHLPTGVPLVESLLVRHWLGTAAGDGFATFGLAAGGRLVIPHGRSVAACYVPTAEGWQRVADAATDDVDGFAPSLPVTTRPLPDHPVAALSPVQVREAAALYAATAIGSAAAALDRSVAYARTRHTFGAPIGSRQSVKHLLADMYCDLELARSGLVAAVATDDWTDLLTTALRRARSVAVRGIQVHGGIGFTWEAGIHLFVKHVLAVEKLIRILVGQVGHDR